MKSLLKSLATKTANILGPHRLSRADKNLWVLMYHRILPLSDPRCNTEEPGMIVTPDSFEMQMHEIKRHFDVVDLEDWVQLKLQNANLPRKACAITFDDGWLDNYQYAFPILQKHQIPFTVFAVSEKVGSDFSFWPNRIAEELLAGNLEKLREQNIFAAAFTRLSIQDDTSSREGISKFINALKVNSEKEIYAALENLPSSVKDVTPSRSLMDWSEIQTMIDSGLCKVGSHTCSHQRLTHKLNATELEKEILTSQQQLASTLSKPVNLFCYPNGDSHSAVEELVGHYYKAAVTTKRGIACGKSTPLHLLPRIGVHEDVSNSPEKFGARLSGWL